MKFIKRLSTVTAALVLGLSSMMAIGFAPLVSAASGSDTCTWTGAGGNSNFSTAGNWNSCSSAAPVNGDNLVFDVTSLTSNAVLNNDIANLTVGTITFQGTHNTNYNGYALSGSAITVSSGITDSSGVYNQVGSIILGSNMTLRGSINFTNAAKNAVLNLNGYNLVAAGSSAFESLDEVTGSGGISVSGGGDVSFQSSAASNWSGTLSLSGSGSSVSINPGSMPGAATINVGNGSILVLCGFNGASLANSITIGGRGVAETGGTYSGAIGLYPSCQGGGPGGGFESQASANFSGPVTLTSDTTASGSGQLKVTGALSGNYTLAMEPGQAGNVDIESSNNQSGSSIGSQSSQTQTTTYSANSPTTGVSAAGNQVAIVDGVYGDAQIGGGGVLKGDGTVNSIEVFNGGIVAPGHSPGKLTVVKTLTLYNGAIYQAELKDTAAGDYDQTVVGSSSDTTGNDVSLGDTNGSPTLDVSLYTGYSIKDGDQFTIIDNLSKTPVSGTFANMPEGSTFAVGSEVFQITYKGGANGNSVVLTAERAVGAPDTGFTLVSSHLLATLAAVIIIAGAILGLARRTRLAGKRR